METAAANAAGQAIMNTAEAKVNENGDSCCPSMSFQQRVFWFCFTGILGFGIIIFTFLKLNPYYLAAGTALAITSTFFLNGWEAQKKKLLDPVRFPCVIIIIGTTIASIILEILGKKSKPLLLTIYIVEAGAVVWYFLSYIPYGREFCIKCCKCCFRTAKETFTGNQPSPPQ